MAGVPIYSGDPDGPVAVRAERAAVVPRVCGADGGDPLPIEVHVGVLLRRGARGLVTLAGAPGSGTTTALRHLVATLPSGAPVRVFDDVTTVIQRQDVAAAARSALVVCRSAPDTTSPCVSRLAMVPWGDDDLIEYLLVRHRRQCQAVMTRVKPLAGQLSLEGSPEVWRMVLDTMAQDGSIPDVPAALRRCLAPLLSDPRMYAGAAALRCLQEDGDPGRAAAMSSWAFDQGVQRLIRHRCVQVLLASELIVRNLCDGVGWGDLEGKLPHDLVIETARLAAHWPAAVERLAALVAGNMCRVQPMAVSVLLAARPDWRPGAGSVPMLSGAYAAGARWAGVDLHAGRISGAQLDRADLTGANLRAAYASAAHLRGATLRGARLDGLKAPDSVLAGADLAEAIADGAKLARADLRGADLRAASLCGADLTEADLSRARLAQSDLSRAELVGTKLAGADLTGADLSSAVLYHLDFEDVDLTGARFRSAEFKGCRMEGLSLPKADFAGAKLRRCDLTGARMPAADLREADLRNTRLADVDWEGADLREADLRGATFHMGSSRSGLVGSTVQCEGSKTGFYTDDYGDQDFKSPEEIRKANLRGADLRGARVKGVDFYLVDLRGARYTDRQGRYFRRCGAILDPF